jgi:hypothetical protein
MMRGLQRTDCAWRTLPASLLGIVLLAGVIASPLPASAQSTVITCDRVVNASPWNRQLSAVNTGDVLCYQFSGAAIAAEVQRLNGAALIELQVSRGTFDAFVFIAPATSANLADQMNDAPVAAGSAWRSFAFNNVSPALNYVIAIAPATEARGNYRLRVVPGAVPPATAIPIPTAQVTLFPTTADAPCSRFALSLSGLCIDPFPVPFNGTLSVLWRIPNFRFGELDSGDGRGFVGPIAWQQKVEVPNITAPRVIRLRWIDTAGRQFVDSIWAQVGPPAITPTPTVNPNAFPCSRAGMGISNLCVEPPYPVRRGTSAFVVWRIVDFRFGEFDSGDGRGFVGPVGREQRVEVQNVNAPRLIRLRWVDSSNQWREDSFVIQVTDAATPIP